MGNHAAGIAHGAVDGHLVFLGLRGGPLPGAATRRPHERHWHSKNFRQASAVLTLIFLKIICLIPPRKKQSNATNTCSNRIRSTVATRDRWFPWNVGDRNRNDQARRSGAENGYERSDEPSFTGDT